MILRFTLAVFFSSVIAYLLGSCNSSIIVVKLLKGEDIRKFGSFNAGLTNTLRCFGKLPAALTLIGDFSKGVIAVLLCKLVCSFLGVGLGAENDVHFIGYVAGFFAVIGHIFPLYYGFKGGKGVLVGVSIFLVIDPIVFVILILIFAIILSITKYVSLSSIIATVCCPFATFIIQFFALKTSLNLSVVYTIMVIPICFLVIYMHRTNIIRLKNGTENKFSFHKKEE